MKMENKIQFIAQIITICTLTTKTTCNESENSGDFENRVTEGAEIAFNIAKLFVHIFERCAESSMPNQHYIIDDLKSFVNYPSKTTVGYAPKFTSNRKFFANMISSTAFKEMLAKDEEEVRKSEVNKLKYCDEAVMDQELLKDFYDREIDQSKI